MPNLHKNKIQTSTGEVWMDLTSDTVTAETLLKDVTAHDRSGAQITGTVIVAPTDVTETEDNEAYLYKSSEHDAVYDELVGGSVAWNQLVANSGSSLSVTITSGHKYVMKKNGTLSVGASSGSAITGLTGGTDWITDLTLMFGTTIADYIYNLEQSAAGSGIAWLKSYGFFTKDYYAYSAGGLVSVNTSGKKVVGENQCDKVKVGVYYTSNGNYDAALTAYSCTEKIKILPNTQYTVSVIKNSGSIGTDNGVLFYDANGAYLGKNTGGYSHTDTYPFTFTTPSNATYCGIDINIQNSSIVGVQLELGSTATNYEPYTSITYPIQSTDLRGLYKLNGNKLYTDGDIYSADGQITRKYGYRDYQSGDESLANAITDGTHTIYKLSAPTTVTASSFSSPQMVYRNGTEEYLDTRDVPIPVGGNRKYVDIPEWMVNEYFDDLRAETSTVSNIIEKLRRIDVTNGSSSTVRTIYAPDANNGIRTTVRNNRTEVQVACGQASNANGKVVFTEGEIYGGIGNPTSASVNHFMFNDDCVGDSIGKQSSGSPLTGSEFDLNYETINLNGSTINIDDNMSMVFETEDDFTVNTINSPYMMINTDGISLLPKTLSYFSLLISRLPSGAGSELVVNSNGTVYQSSSSRDIKHDIQYIENTDTYHDALMRIKPATYVYNNDASETTKLGMIAEDIADVMPIAALTDECGKVENYDTRAIIAMLVMEVQRLNADIRRLRGDSNAD